MQKTDNYDFKLQEKADTFSMIPQNENWSDIDVTMKAIETKMDSMGETLLRQFLLAAYPVGSIIMSSSSANPQEIYGGTWEAWGTGRVPVGIDSAQAEFATSGKAGGSKTQALTVAQTPAHTHGSKALSGKFHNVAVQSVGTAVVVSGICKAPATSGIVGYAVSNKSAEEGYGDVVEVDATHEHASVGSGTAHNNLQPYITCYMWKRTA